MIEELKIIQAIFGDLTGLGLWGVSAWFAYKILIVGAWLYFGVKIVMLAKWIFDGVERRGVAESGAAQERDKYRREAEEVKHMYKILKEAKGVKDDK